VGTGCLARNKKSESIVLSLNLITQFFVETFVGIAIGYLLGRLMDNWLFEDRQIFIYILMILGMMSGLANLIKRVLKNISGGDQSEEKDEHH
jgi:F0F1-type ATP synthase assembly protein I